MQNNNNATVVAFMIKVTFRVIFLLRTLRHRRKEISVPSRPQLLTIIALNLQYRLDGTVTSFLRCHLDGTVATAN